MSDGFISRLDPRSSVEWTYKKVYRGPLKTVLQKTGLNSPLNSLYWSLYYLMTPHSRVEIGDIVASFHTGSKSEQQLFEVSLPGERVVIEDVLNRVAPDDVFYDIGANVGTYTCMVSKCLSDGTVVAVEPYPKNIRRLRQNLALNQQSAEVLEYAFHSEHGIGKMNLRSTETGTQTGTLSSQELADWTVEVPLVPGDELIDAQSLPQPTIVKIDVEGAEIPVIQGLLKTLAEDSCRLVYCEVHNDGSSVSQAAVDTVRNLLQECGFTPMRIHERRDGIFLRGVK